MPASRFHDGRHGATHTVRILVFGRELRIAGEDGATFAAWPLARIAAAPEVDPDGVVSLTARGEPGVLLIDDPADLASIGRAGIRLPRNRVWSRRHWVLVCAGLAATLCAGMLALNTVPRWLAAALPLAWEQRLGEPAQTTMAASRRRCGGAAGQAALERLVARLRAAGPIEMPVTIAVFDDPRVNAFTLPGGHVMVMRGLIDTAADGPMLAGVIAHELGHVAHRDSTTLLLRSMGFSILLRGLGSGDAGGLAAAGASNLMNLSYSRAAEAAADATAIDLLTDAGLRADGLSRFFALMEHRAGVPAEAAGHEAEDRTGTAADWFATHPSSESRRERTARPPTGEMPFTDAEWLAIKAMCAAK